ncbi:MAG: radical SAM protein [Deltaproteobacteria bacterium]|nr:radical SAM protein [Deltaproteobacteria bacterium]
MKIQIHSIIPSSRVNGPGKRLVVFFQGCKRNCTGCFNPSTHPTEADTTLSPEEILDSHLRDGTEGITISGGEPFLQATALTKLLSAARKKGLSTLVYSGYTLEELKGDKENAPALALIDVLIDGPYMKEKHERGELPRGSANQSIHFLSTRYGLSDLRLKGRSEIIIDTSGNITATGFNPETTINI